MREILTHSSLLVALLFLVKSYGVVRFSLITSAAIVTTAPLSTILGIVAIYAYLAMPTIASGVLWWLVALRGRPPGWHVNVLGIGVLAALLSPLGYLVDGVARRRRR